MDVATDIAVTPGKPMSAVKPLAAGKFMLQLGGMFSPDWVGGLCGQLSQRRIDVERGYARQVQRGIWESMFTIRPLIAGVDMAKVDFLAMVHAPQPAIAAAAPTIKSFTLTEAQDAVTVSLRAADKTGLLAQLLSVFSLQMLFIHDVKIETIAAEAHDTFVLKALGARPPGLESRRLLNTKLKSMAAGTPAVALRR